jgi:hypothetical protein
LRLARVAQDAGDDLQDILFVVNDQDPLGGHAGLRLWLLPAPG